MNPTTELTRGPGPSAGAAPEHHVRHLLEDVFGPVDTSAGRFERRLLQTRSALAHLGLLATLVQLVVWLMIGLVTAHLDAPWWLWTTVPAVAGVAALTVVRRWHRSWTPAGAMPQQEASR